MAPENLKPLTSLRFFAAFWVVMFHYWPKLSDQTPAFVEKGYLGVELFFVLSGFILCHVYLQARGEGRFSYGGFLWARLARVYPLHLFTLAGVGLMGAAAAVAGVGIDPNVTALSALPANLTMTHAWGLSPVAGWNHPSWSISAEWFAYLSFPAFAWAAWALRGRPQVAVALALVLIFALYAAFERAAGFPLTQATIAWGALRIVPCFAFGCAVHLAWKAGAVARPGMALGGALASLVGIVAFSIAGIPDAVIVSLFGLLILSLAGLSASNPPVLSSPAFVWLGEVSYSIYMIVVPWKLLFPNLAEKLLGIGDGKLPLLVWLGFTLALIPLAGLSYHLVEKPAREAMRRFAARRARERTTLKVA
jgi:peptidoglycan/LPS O-acetylase OafA/YrhL